MTTNTPALVARLADSERLRQRRLEMLPLRGDGAVFTEPQGRQPGDATAPEELADLISSISSVGLLQPVLVEELQQDQAQKDGRQAPRLRLVSGERRLRAMRWGAVHQPDNPQFTTIPAVVCPGPLTQAERRVWQLVENVAREDLQPGELAAALLWERCAIATAKLLTNGRQLPTNVTELEDPVKHWQALEKLRGPDTECAAPWSEVLRRLGLQLSPRKARQLVRAFAELPREISDDMDAHKVSLHTRITFAALHNGRAAAANEIWQAVKQRRRPDLLPAALQTSLDRPDTNAQEALASAEELHDSANQARADKLRTHHTAQTDGKADGTSAADHTGEAVDPEILASALRTCRDLAHALRNGATLPRFDTGSLRLLLGELHALLDTANGGRS